LAGQRHDRRNTRRPRRHRSHWPWLLGLIGLATVGALGVLLWSRSESGKTALLNLGADQLYTEVQAHLDDALATVLPDLQTPPSHTSPGASAAAEFAGLRYDWPLPDAGPEAAIRCRVVAVAGDTSWWQVQDRLAGAIRSAGGRVLWSERLPRSSQARDLRQPAEPRDLLRVDIGTSGRPTHTLLLYRQGTARPQVHWGADPSATAWRQLQARANGPVVALVIDDWGHRADATTSGLAALEIPLTMAILPSLPYSRRFALAGTELALPPAAASQERGYADEAGSLRQAAGCPVTLGLGTEAGKLPARRREIFLHLPMEPQGYPDVDPGPRVVLVGMSGDRVAELLDEALHALPNISGVNNHMGSAATADAPTMRTLMAELKARDLIFLDSLTSANSVAYQTARAAGVPAARNRIFLDHDRQDQDRIRSRLRALVQAARASGFAIGIGHPHPATLQVLREELPRLQAEGVEFVTVSELLALQTARAAAGS
jgi:polysaccharide deacetylase 2 family uncharacterized protein YibQ